MVLSGVIATSEPGTMTFSSTSGRTITLGNANTYGGATVISERDRAGRRNREPWGRQLFR